AAVAVAHAPGFDVIVLPRIELDPVPLEAAPALERVCNQLFRRGLTVIDVAPERQRRAVHSLAAKSREHPVTAVPEPNLVLGPDRDNGEAPGAAGAGPLGSRGEAIPVVAARAGRRVLQPSNDSRPPLGAGGYRCW